MNRPQGGIVADDNVDYLVVIRKTEIILSGKLQQKTHLREKGLTCRVGC